MRVEPLIRDYGWHRFVTQHVEKRQVSYILFLLLCRLLWRESKWVLRDVLFLLFLKINSNKPLSDYELAMHQPSWKESAALPFYPSLSPSVLMPLALLAISPVW